MTDGLLIAGLLGALTVGGLLLVFLVLRRRLDGLAADVSSTRREVQAVDRALREAAERATAAARDPEVVPSIDLREPPPPIDLGEHLDPLHDELRGLRRDLQTIGRRVDELSSLLEEGRGRRLGQTIRERFERQGFQSLRILAEPSDLEAADVRVPLEGVKGGITYKGYVVVEDGHVVDEKMTSSYEVFP